MHRDDVEFNDMESKIPMGNIFKFYALFGLLLFIFGRRFEQKHAENAKRKPQDLGVLCDPLF